MPKHHGGGYLKNLNFFCLESTIALLRLCPNFVKEQAARCCLQLILQLYATTQKRGSSSAARICEQNFDLPMTGSIWGQNTSFCVIFRVYRKGFCPHDCPFLSYKYLRILKDYFEQNQSKAGGIDLSCHCFMSWCPFSWQMSMDILSIRGNGKMGKANRTDRRQFSIYILYPFCNFFFHHLKQQLCNEHPLRHLEVSNRTFYA